MKDRLVSGIRQWRWRFVLAALILVFATSCSPYASISIGVPFNGGPFYVNPSIGIGGFL